MSTNNTKTYEASCHCGSVRITLTHLPEFLHNCNCSLCRKSGGVWGYFSRSDVKILGETQRYERRDLPAPTIQVHFCNVCGATTHWSAKEAHKLRRSDGERMGINMQLFEIEQLVGIEVRFPNGKEWNGDGGFEYYRESIILHAAVTI